MQNLSEVTVDLTTATNVQLNSTTYMYQEPDFSDVYKSPIGIIRICLCSLGLVLNLLSVLAVLHVPHGFKNHIKLILSLALSDSLTIVGVLAHKLHLLLPHEVLNTWCATLWVIQVIHMALFATLLNLLAMAADHYIAIMKPLQYSQICTPFRGNCVICLIWLVSILVGSSDFFVALFVHIGDEDPLICYQANIDDFNVQFLILPLVLAVFVILMVVYIKIYLVVRRMVREHQSLTQDETHSYKAIVTTFLILGTFILCWIPYNINQVHMIIMFYTGNSLNADLDDILFLLLISNSLCDPIIYAVRLGQVQVGYKRMFFRYCPRFLCSQYEQDFNSIYQNNSIHRRNTHAITVESDISENRRHQSNNTETGMSMVPLENHNKNDVQPKAKTITFSEHYQKDCVANIMEDDPEGDLRNNTTDTEEAKQECETAQTNDEDEKSSNTNITPVSPGSDKELWSDTEVSNLI